MARLVIVGAHALDGELMAGGLAAAASSRGAEVTLLHMTRGERGHPSKPPEVFGPQLETELAAAAAALGASAEWAGIRAPLADVAQAERTVAAAIARLKPDAVVTHWRGSWHPSHVNTHSAVARAVWAAGGVALLFGENCEDLTGFAPDRFADTGATYDRWLSAVREYELFRLSEPCREGQTAAIPYWAYYTAAARIRGLQAGVERAQVFMAGDRRDLSPLGVNVLPGL